MVQETPHSAPLEAAAPVVTVFETRRRRLLAKASLAAGCLALAAAAALGSRPAQAQVRGPERPPLMVGGFDSIGEQLNPNNAGNVMRKIRRVGFGYVKEEVTWVNHQRRPSPADNLALANSIESAEENNLKVILLFLPSTWHEGTDGNVPLRPNQQRDFCDMVSNVLREFPGVAAAQIGNEEGNPVFWRPQFLPNGTDAVAGPYEALMARCYDDIKAINPTIEVIGGGLAPHGNDDPHSSRPSHSPVNLLLDIGKAYRASGRTRPIMDALGLHPYIQPGDTLETPHPAPSTTIGAGDYDKLVQTLAQAFDFEGSGQPGASLPVIYDEFAERVQPSRDTRKESDLVPVNTQIADYSELLRLARCDQPTVQGVIFFKIFDNPDWPSGMYSAKGNRNPNYYSIRKAINNAQDPAAAC